MKKIILLVLFVSLTTGVFAQIQMSVGGGVFTDMSFFNGYTAGDVNVGWRNIGCSGFVFCDADYLELAVGFGYGLMSKVVKRSPVPVQDKPDFGDMCQLDLGLMGKYPFRTGSFTIFPLIGMSYKCVLYIKDPASKSVPYKNHQFNQFGLFAGIGLDHDFSDSVYFRTEGLFHFRFPMDFVRENVPSGASVTNGYGGRIKIGIGYRF